MEQVSSSFEEIARSLLFALSVREIYMLYYGHKSNKKQKEVTKMLYFIVGSVILGLLVVGTLLSEWLVKTILRFMEEEERC